MTKPNSDKSGRAARRREDREVKQAVATVARAKARPQPLPATGGVRVSIDEMTQLVIERDIMINRLKQQIALQQNQLTELRSGQEELPEVAVESTEELTTGSPERALPED